jgi:hypothetical protein
LPATDLRLVGIAAHGNTVSTLLLVLVQSQLTASVERLPLWFARKTSHYNYVFFERIKNLFRIFLSGLREKKSNSDPVIDALELFFNHPQRNFLLIVRVYRQL